MAIIYPYEHEIQTTVVQWARFHPAIHENLFHIPNGGYRSPKEAAKFKRMGVLSGVADMFMPLPTKSLHGLWIEFKRHGGKLTKNQQEFLDRMKSFNYGTLVASSVEEGIEGIRDYLELKK